jgi:protein-S-isoprenylcysteine O-methyltransferase Ste14
LIQQSTLVWLYVVIIAIFFDIKSRKEERWLVERFPAYADYQGRVRKLIPWVY